MRSVSLGTSASLFVSLGLIVQAAALSDLVVCQAVKGQGSEFESQMQGQVRTSILLGDLALPAERTRLL